MSDLDPYEILGVERTASAAEIKSAWRKAAAAAHPDREGGSDARMADVNAAYEILSNGDRRAAYDKTGHTGIPRATWIQQRGRDILIETLSRVLSQWNEDADHCGVIRQLLDSRRTDLTRKRADCELKLESLRKRMKRLKGPPEGVLHKVMQNALDEGAKFLEQNAAEHLAVDRAIAMLSEYSWESGPPLLAGMTFVFAGGGGTGASGG